MRRKRFDAISEMQEAVRRFSEARDWDRYHNAKDLAVGIVTEGAELLEHFRFRSPAEVEAVMSRPAVRQEVGREMADILAFLLRLAQRYDIDLPAAFRSKMAENRRKYPVAKCRGSNRKYTELPG